MKDSTVLVILVLIFCIIPLLPNFILMLTDYLLIRVLLLIFFLSLANKSPLYAIVGLMSIAFLFIERNRVKLHNLRQSMEQSSEDSPAIQSIVTPETAPPQPVFDSSTGKSIPFSPQDDSGSNSFAPVAPTLNEKEALPTETTDGSQKAMYQLFQWVNPNLIQAP